MLKKTCWQDSGTHYYIFSMVLFSFPFLPKGAAAGLNCNLEDIRLTGGLLSPLSLTSCRTPAPAMAAELSPGWDPVWPVLPNLSNPSNPALKWHTTVPGMARLGGFELKCGDSAGGQFTRARPTPAKLMRLKSSRVEQKESSHSQRSSWGPVTSAVGVCAQNPLPATTKVCLGSKDLQNTSSVKATPGR